MKIQTRLYLLIGGICLLFAVIIAIFFSTLAPIEKMKSEQEIFQEALDRTLQFTLEINRFSSGILFDQKKQYDSTFAEWSLAMDKVKQVSYLPSISTVLKDAITTIGNLKELGIDSTSQIESTYNDLAEDANRLFSSPESVKYFDFFGSGMNTENGQMDGLTQFHLTSFSSTIDYLNETMKSTSQTIREQENIINNEVSKIAASGLTTAIIIIVICLIGALIIAILIVKSIQKSLKSMEANVHLMGTGDLTGRFNVKNKDEIGDLGRNMNTMLSLINQSLVEIQEASNQNISVKDNLIEAVSEATSSAIEIDANSSSIKHQMENLDGMIDSSSNEVKNIQSNITVFGKRVSAQNRHIEDSVAAVTEMLASISNITKITERDRKSAKELVEQSENSKAVFDNAFDKVNEITESIDLIQEMASVIAGISSQTNILAMNAAIEAAHAGEFGKGFAVVADEIGQLASASATSSDEIASTIQKIVVKINEAASTRNETSNAINNITEKIQMVSDSVVEIHDNVAEMEIGSKQVLDSMEELKSSSAEITRDVTVIENGIVEVGTNMDNSVRISHEVGSNISEISIGLKEISKIVRNVQDHAALLGETGSTLNIAVQRFKTKGNTTDLDLKPEVEEKPESSQLIDELK